MFYGFAMCNVYSIACTNSKNGLIIMPDEDKIFIDIKQRDNKWFLLSLVSNEMKNFPHLLFVIFDPLSKTITSLPS